MGCNFRFRFGPAPVKTNQIDIKYCFYLILSKTSAVIHYSDLCALNLPHFIPFSTKDDYEISPIQSIVIAS